VGGGKFKGAVGMQLLASPCLVCVQ